MTRRDKQKSPQPRYSGGIFIGFGAVAGAIIGGLYMGQPMLGFLIGTALGSVIAILIWLLNRR